MKKLEKNYISRASLPYFFLLQLPALPDAVGGGGRIDFSQMLLDVIKC
jgi:hypothetical protein